VKSRDGRVKKDEIEDELQREGTEMDQEFSTNVWLFSEKDDGNKRQGQ
jgi:hypothetical protein